MIDVAAMNTASNQSKVSEASDQVTSGLRVSKPSDDPTAYMAAQRASARMTLSKGATSALNTSKERLELSDGALGGIGAALDSMREIATQGANATYNAQDRKDMATQVRALFQAALGSANTQAADGEYILAGTSSTTPPFDAAGNYVGNSTDRNIATTETDSTGSLIAGSALTTASGVDVLPLFGKIADALEANDMDSVHNLLGDVNTAVQQVGLSRTRTGGALNIMQSAISAHADLDLHLQTTIKDNVEADVIAAASTLAKASTAFEASKTVTSHLMTILDPRQS
jgi:flagellar hook-associated protein 3 FlgL